MLASRLDAVDRVKACAILAVAVTHAGPARWSPAWTATDEWLRMMLPAFHVPAFLVIAGFLYRTEQPMPWAEVGRRIARVVVPYLVVLSVLYATHMAPWPGWRGLPFAILTGESYGMFYFAPVLVVCIFFGWLLSRLSDGAIVALTLALFAYVMGVLAFVTPPPWVTFWGIRDPFGRFYLGYFACGWLGVPRALGTWSRWRLALIALAMLVVWGIWGLPSVWPLRLLPSRIIYTFAVVGLLWQATWRFPGMRFLSDASLAVFLLHRPVMDLLPVIDQWPPVSRIAVTACGGVGGAVLLCLAARVVLGRDRARRWIGA